MYKRTKQARGWDARVKGCGESRMEAAWEISLLAAVVMGNGPEQA
jgi:hypothetical protein